MRLSGCCVSALWSDHIKHVYVKYLYSVARSETGVILSLLNPCVQLPPQVEVVPLCLFVNITWNM